MGLHNMIELELLEEAKKYISKPMYIVNLYDMSLAWIDITSGLTAGYSPEELKNMNVLDLMIADSSQKLREENLARAIKEHGLEKITIKNKDGSTNTYDIEFKTFTFQDVMYSVGKVVHP